jgi:hypothetical protein
MHPFQRRKIGASVKISKVNGVNGTTINAINLCNFEKGCVWEWRPQAAEMKNGAARSRFNRS